jgi:uncharacterized protein (DUF302 family)
MRRDFVARRIRGVYGWPGRVQRIEGAHESRCGADDGERREMIRGLATFFLLIALALPAAAGSLAPRPGWEVHDTAKSYSQLIDDLKQSVKSEKMIVVTQAGPTQAAKRRGIEIPGNRVLGVFNNDFAVRTLKLSVAAMIEAPIRFYVTENEDGTATLSYKTPSHVFAPYLDEGGGDLRAVAHELDGIFARIAERAIAG